VNLLGEVRLNSGRNLANPFYGSLFPVTRWFDTVAFPPPPVPCGERALKPVASSSLFAILYRVPDGSS
jgi:hypothetical protein